MIEIDDVIDLVVSLTFACFGLLVISGTLILLAMAIKTLVDVVFGA